MTTNLMRRALLFSVLLAVGSGLAGCSDDFLAEDPPDQLVADNLYVNVEGFDSGLNALYSQVRNDRSGLNDVNESATMFWAVGVDNGWVNWDTNVERLFSDWGTLNVATFGNYNRYFVDMYRTINAANTIINRAELPAANLSDTDKVRVLAEARFFRAWAYRRLTYMWGDVPLNTDEASGATIRTDWERAPVAEVLTFMEQDLLFASENLPAAPPRDSKVGKAVADHYLSEYYLRVNDPAKAEQYARAVIAGPYRLVTQRYGNQTYPRGCAFLDQFRDGNASRSQGNTESLWTIQNEFEVLGGGQSIMRRYWVNRYYSIRGLQVSNDYGGRGIGRLAITKWALEQYEPQDERGFKCAIRRDYLYNDPANLPAGRAIGDTIRVANLASRERTASRTTDWPSTRKWDWTDATDLDVARSYGDQPYLRLAETYLLLAEAQFKQGNLGGAAESINMLRNRAKATPVSAGNVTLAYILDERSRELVTEEDRRFTLLRTGTWLDRTRRFNLQVANKITDRDLLYPIPQAVIDANLTTPMRQNPGY